MVEGCACRPNVRFDPLAFRAAQFRSLFFHLPCLLFFVCLNRPEWRGKNDNGFHDLFCSSGAPISVGLYSANCVATKFNGKFVESASFSSSSSSSISSRISSSSSRRRDNDELLLLSSTICISVFPSANCWEARRKCGSKKCVCKEFDD